jgi:hypothetical protein
MSTLWSVNGIDLSSIFEPRNGTTAYSTLQNIKYLGTDLTSIFMDKNANGIQSSASIITNIAYNHIDIGSIFQRCGYSPGITLRQTITSGSGTWYASSLSGVIGFTPSKVIVVAVAGGGAGGGTDGSTAGVGGSGGGFDIGIVDVSSSSGTAYSVGAGGTGNLSAPGNDGNNTTFGTLTVTKGLGAGFLTYSYTPKSGGSPNGGNGGGMNAGNPMLVTVGTNSQIISTYNNQSIYVPHGVVKKYGLMGSDYAYGGASAGDGGDWYSGAFYVGIGGGGIGYTTGVGAKAGGPGGRGEIRIYY